MDINRKAAFEALLDIETKGAYSNIAANATIKKYNPDDEALVRTLIYGVVENQIYLDYKLSHFVKSGLKKTRPQVLVLIRMGAYQIEFMDSIPSYAAINECVKIAKKVCRGLDGFVNGVLRSYDRAHHEVALPDRHTDLTHYLSVRYSCTEDIADIWLKMYGEKGAEELLAASNAAPPLTIRVNQLKTDAHNLAKEFTDAGFHTRHVKTGDATQDETLHDMALEVSGTGVLATDMFAKGLFSVQDVSSMLAISALTPHPGSLVIDVCAAPGGKSLCAAELMRDKGEIISCDIYEHKLELIKKTAARLGISIIHTEKNDGTVLCKDFIDRADCVIVDAPCSGLGVVRRKPEIKLRVRRSDVENLAQLQLEILENAAQYVVSGGRLLYSTCTVTDEENQGVLKLFLQKNKNFFLVLEKQLLPNIDNADGFYFSVLERF